MKLNHAEKCPVCLGEGTVIDSAVFERTDTGTVPVSTKRKPCHGCKGLGWVTVHDFGTEGAPAQPYPYPLPYIPPLPPTPTWPYEMPWNRRMHDPNIVWCTTTTAN